MFGKKWRIVVQTVNRLVKGGVCLEEVRFVNLLNLSDALFYLLVVKFKVSKK